MQNEKSPKEAVGVMDPLFDEMSHNGFIGVRKCHFVESVQEKLRVVV